MTASRKILLLLCCAGWACIELPAQSGALNVQRQGNRLVLTAPQLHFLAGKPLDQLHNGAAVAYIFSLTLAVEGAPPFQLRERHIVSYDLWEERFSIVQAEPAGRTVSHLTAAAAESWCMENLQIPVSALKSEKPFSIRLECTVEDTEKSDSGAPMTLAGLIDVFSRKKRDDMPRWEAATGQLRLSELKGKKAQSR